MTGGRRIIGWPPVADYLEPSFDGPSLLLGASIGSYAQIFIIE
jgi:hypothetical protein